VCGATSKKKLDDCKRKSEPWGAKGDSTEDFGVRRVKKELGYAVNILQKPRIKDHQ